MLYKIFLMWANFNNLLKVKYRIQALNEGHKQLHVFSYSNI
jgi:hypothetical protein